MRLVLFSNMGVGQLLGEEEWRCGIRTSWISHLVVLVTLDIPGRYITGHHNNTTHTGTCLFPKAHMTMSFNHLRLQRHYSVQVTIIFYKRGFDYIDIYNMDGINHRGRKSEGLFQSCSAVWTWSCLTSLGLSLFICKVWWRTHCHLHPHLHTLPPCSWEDPHVEAPRGNVNANRRCGTEPDWTTAWTLT